MLIGLASAAATEVATAGVVLAIALAIEMGFTGLAYAATPQQNLGLGRSPLTSA